MHQTQHFENLLSLESKTIQLLRAIGHAQLDEKPLLLDTVKSELRDIPDIDKLLS